MESTLEDIMILCKPQDTILSYTPPHEVLFHGSGKKLQRNIFKHQNFTTRETEKIKRLKEMITKEKLKIPENWDDSELLKFVYGSDFKTRNAFKALKSCLESRDEVLTKNFLLLYGKIYEILKSGPLYFHGRDCHYRPLLVMNFTKFDLKKYPFDLYLQAACFVLEFASNFMLFPGKVENWMCISDLGYRGLSDLPLNTMRKITKVLQDIFKCRMAYSTMINAPKTIYFIYSCVKPFLDAITIDKITIEQGSIPTKIISFFNPYQVEERYGGKAKNLEVFWPPVFPDTSLGVDSIPVSPSPEEEVFQNDSPEEIQNHSQEIFDREEIIEVLETTPQPKKEKSRRKKRRNKEKKQKSKKIETSSFIQHHLFEEEAALTDEDSERVLRKPSKEVLAKAYGLPELVLDTTRNPSDLCELSCRIQ